MFVWWLFLFNKSPTQDTDETFDIGLGLYTRKGWRDCSPLIQPFDGEVELEVELMIQLRPIETESGGMAGENLRELSIMGLC